MTLASGYQDCHFSFAIEPSIDTSAPGCQTWPEPSTRPRLPAAETAEAVGAARHMKPLARVNMLTLQANSMVR